MINIRFWTELGSPECEYLPSSISSIFLPAHNLYCPDSGLGMSRGSSHVKGSHAERVRLRPREEGCSVFYQELTQWVGEGLWWQFSGRVQLYHISPAQIPRQHRGNLSRPSSSLNIRTYLRPNFWPQAVILLRAPAPNSRAPQCPSNTSTWYIVSTNESNTRYVLLEKNECV